LIKPLYIIYIHGFNSSGIATKSQLLRDYLHKNFSDIPYYSPTLIHDPIKAMQQLHAQLDSLSDAYRFCFVGSSLGGYYAIYLAHHYRDAKAVLVNPATNPWQTMYGYCGDYKNDVTGEEFSVTPEFVACLERFRCDPLIAPERFLLLLQTDDDIIDYRIAKELFAHSPQVIRSGGGHQFSDFKEVLPQIMAFFRQ